MENQLCEQQGLTSNQQSSQPTVLQYLSDEGWSIFFIFYED